MNLFVKVVKIQQKNLLFDHNGFTKLCHLLLAKNLIHGVITLCSLMMILFDSDIFGQVLESDEAQSPPTFQLAPRYQWQRSDASTIYGDPSAKKGGTVRFAKTDAPTTFRRFGSDAHSDVHGFIKRNQMSLLYYHYQTKTFRSGLADYWAMAPSGDEVVYHIDPRARWSDGRAVTSKDFLYYQSFVVNQMSGLESQRHYFERYGLRIRALSPQVVAVSVNRPYPPQELLYITNITPLYHGFYQPQPGWMRDMNWAIEPNTGPYQISAHNLGELVTFKRKKDWWGYHRPAWRNLYNFDNIEYHFVSTWRQSLEKFIAGEVDHFSMRDELMPAWAEELYKRRSDIQTVILRCHCDQLIRAIFLNLSRQTWRDPRLRRAFIHGMNISQMIQESHWSLERTHSLFPVHDDFSADLPTITYDPDKVSHYMTEAGWVLKKSGIFFSPLVWQKEGQLFRRTLFYTDKRDESKLAILKRDALAAGIMLEIKFLHKNDFFDNLRSNDYDALWLNLYDNHAYPSYEDLYHSNSITAFGHNVSQKFEFFGELILTQVNVVHKIAPIQ
ncbi:MAG: ABC transporter substrate-binding protein, partial [Proteobacteria bacterium]|nr:ABC transporter substrate-binding protein [Pseudomonadota bacterium]